MFGHPLLALFFPHVEKRKFMIETSRDEKRGDLPSSTLARSPVPECISAYKFDALSVCMRMVKLDSSLKMERDAIYYASV